MHISMTELKAALRRCFEATGYYVGNYEDAANMILWLEKHGLDGLKELQSALPYIGDDSSKPLSTKTLFIPCTIEHMADLRWDCVF